MVDIVLLMAKEYFGNTVYQYGIAFSILIAFIVSGRILDFFIKKYFKAIANKTKSKIDDILVNSIEKPFFMFVFVLGLYSGFYILAFPAGFSNIFEKLMSTLLIFAVSWFFINLVDQAIISYLEPLTKKSESELDDHLVPLLRKLVRSALVVIAVIMVMSDLGFDVASIIAGLGIGGLAFALAAKDLLANLFGGVAIILDKSFGINQRIKVQGVDGKVKQIGLRTTVIESFDGTKLTIPNSKIADSIIENVSHEQARKISITLGVSCDTSNKKIEQYIKKLKKSIDAHPNVKDKTVVRFDSFGDFTLNIIVVYWISALSEVGQTKHEINMLIKDETEKLGIDTPYPTQTVNIKK